LKGSFSRFCSCAASEAACGAVGRVGYAASVAEPGGRFYGCRSIPVLDLQFLPCDSIAL
jgi:hypothetical protein